MQTASGRVKLTYEDFLEFPDDGMRHELIDGEHYVTPSPGSAHQLIIGNLYFRIRAYLADHPIGIVMLAPFDIVLSQFDVVEPDLIYFTRERFVATVGEHNARGAPNLAVEVFSPSTRRRDETIKRKLYERMAIGEYWTIDPKREAVRMHRLSDGTYEKAADLTREAGDTLTTILMPGFFLPLSELFSLP